MCNPTFLHRRFEILSATLLSFLQDGKSITISAKQMMDQISISIQDEGMGFKQEDIQKIFDRFTTAGKKGTRGEASDRPGPLPEQKNNRKTWWKVACGK